ncbi:MAG TPA: hypothetical protein VMV03_05435 [Spirochaetia bacterium]|nr:hypothetical protein [Spirochaetia bacterium]
MKKRPSQKDWLPLAKTEKAAAELPTGEAFRVAWIDFEKGIRVGNLEFHERITQILKYGLETRYGTDFITDRWGRGVHWQWICWVPRADREAKPVSHDVNFGCAKFFISVDRDGKIFQSGLQVERGSAPAKDYDWHRLISNCARDTVLDREMSRLVRREGFTARVIGSHGAAGFDSSTWNSSLQVRDAARRAPRGDWAGFQLFYPMPAREVQSCTGLELIQAVLGVFAEVTEAMNQVMQVRLEPVGGGAKRRAKS